jgi:hypothetical protein
MNKENLPRENQVAIINDGINAGQEEIEISTAVVLVCTVA